ncbi:MAG: (deoxy)nucleoside triphosphate pyrophosphohydrolase [Lentisphaerae bacterium]|nr:(deoxy)nucleoside triphosphate pyrophosphohydrolase [Lentisphaerota bacterium]
MEPTSEKRVITVVAAVVRRGDQYLIARRAPEQKLAGLWEFPGGKAHATESPQSALRRELREELDVPARVGRRLGTVEQDEGSRMLRITFYAVDMPDQPLLLRDHDATAWATPAELLTYDLAPADRTFIESLAAGPAP